MTTVAKFLIEPLLKRLTYPAKPIMSFKYPFEKLIKTCNLLYNCKVVQNCLLSQNHIFFARSANVHDLRDG